MLRILIVEDTADRQEILKKLCKDHAWILTNTARRAIALVQSYTFDLIWLDYDLAGKGKGDVVAAFIRDQLSCRARVIVHSMNSSGAQKIRNLLPESNLVPLSKITRNNATFKRVRDELAKGASLDWQRVLGGKRTGS